MARKRKKKNITIYNEIKKLDKFKDLPEEVIDIVEDFEEALSKLEIKITPETVKILKDIEIKKYE